MSFDCPKEQNYILSKSGSQREHPCQFTACFELTDAVIKKPKSATWEYNKIHSNTRHTKFAGWPRGVLNLNYGCLTATETVFADRFMMHQP